MAWLPTPTPLPPLVRVSTDSLDTLTTLDHPWPGFLPPPTPLPPLVRVSTDSLDILIFFAVHLHPNELLIPHEKKRTIITCLPGHRRNGECLRARSCFIYSWLWRRPSFHRYLKSGIPPLYRAQKQGSTAKSRSYRNKFYCLRNYFEF